MLPVPRSNAYHAVACAKRNVHAMSVLTTLVFALKLASRIPFPCPTAISEGDTETQIPKDTETQFHRYTETRDRLHVLWCPVCSHPASRAGRRSLAICATVMHDHAIPVHCCTRSHISGALLPTIMHFRCIFTSVSFALAWPKPCHPPRVSTCVNYSVLQGGAAA